MIRLIQRKLIIPRGDTGSFSIPTIAAASQADVAVFTIFDCLTRTKAFQKTAVPQDSILTIEFTHNDTVNLAPGRYVWDIKFYKNPIYSDGELVNGEEIDSYYAGYSLPGCEIRETGDDYLISPDAPSGTLTPEQLDIISAALSDLAVAVQQTETNVSHYPQIRDEEWYVWSAEVNDYVATGVSANGIVGNGIESAVVNNDYTLTLNFTDGTSYTSGSIRGAVGNGIEDVVLNNDYTLTITFTDGTSYTTPSIRGMVGATPQFSIGTVQEGASAAATITGTAEAPVLNLTLPNANVPTKVSELENDAGYLTEHQDLSGYVQKTDYATENEPGIIRVSSNYGLVNVSKTDIITGESINYTAVMEATAANIKEGTDRYKIISSRRLPNATFYGLAKAAGDTTQSQSSNAVGTYTDEAKAAIQTMLDVPSNADVAAKQDALTFDSTPTANSTNPVTSGGVYSAIANVNTMKIHICTQAEYDAETGVPTIQNPDTQTFYLVPGGEGNNLFIEWAYVNGAWERFGSADVEVPVTDVQVNGTSVVDGEGVAEIPIAQTDGDYGLVKLGSTDMGLRLTSEKLVIQPAGLTNIKEGTTVKPIVPSNQHSAAFYGLAKAAGDTTQSQSNNAVGQYTDEAKAAIQTMLEVPAKDDIPDVPVQDVQVNGVSVLDAQGVANVPEASTTNSGVVKYSNSQGVVLNASGILVLNAAGDAAVKNGTSNVVPITPYREHSATFYGLAKAAGDTTQSASSNAVGQYTDEAKEKIQSMLGITQMLAPENPNLVASQAYAIGDVFAANGHLYKATVAIAQDGTIIPDTNCVETTMVDAGGKIKDVQVAGSSVVGSNGIANIPIANDSTPGVVKVSANGGIRIVSGYLLITDAKENDIKAGTNNYLVVGPARQYISTFYGLSKAAGVDLANETVTLGTYPETSKTAIKEMLGVQDGLKVVRLI